MVYIGDTGLAWAYSGNDFTGSSDIPAAMENQMVRRLEDDTETGSL